MANVAPRPKIDNGPSRRVFDVIVVGGQLSGAVCAALLAKHNYRVLLADHDGLGAGYEHGGYLLPYAPFVFPSLKAMPIVEEVLAELGLNTSVQRSLKPSTPELQLVLPGHRVDLPQDEGARLRELRREFGDLAPAVLSRLKAAAQQHLSSDAFFKERPQLPPSGFLGGFTLKRQAGRHPGLLEAPAIGTNGAPDSLVRGLLPFLSYLSAPTDPLAQSRPLSQALAAPSRFPGGHEGLREVLLKRIDELGGVRLGPENGEPALAESFAFEGNKLVGLKLVRASNEYRASCFVAATDSAALRRLLPEKKRHRKLAEHLDMVSTKEFLFCLHWVLPASVLPRGMGELLVVDSADAELGPLLVQVQPARKVGAKADEENQRVITIAAFLPESARELGEPHLEQIAQRLAGALDELLPFAGERRLLESCPYLHASGVRGSRLLPHPHFEIDAPRYLGVSGVPQRTPEKNLFLANREVLPGLGLEGEVLAGANAAQLVQETLKRSDPLR